MPVYSQSQKLHLITQCRESVLLISASAAPGGILLYCQPHPPTKASQGTKQVENPEVQYYGESIIDYRRQKKKTVSWKTKYLKATKLKSKNKKRKKKGKKKRIC